MSFDMRGEDGCTNCKMLRKEHGLEGKCLFEATFFELMSPEEYEQEHGDPNADAWADLQRDWEESADEVEAEKAEQLSNTKE